MSLRARTLQTQAQKDGGVFDIVLSLYLLLQFCDGETSSYCIYLGGVKIVQTARELDEFHQRAVSTMNTEGGFDGGVLGDAADFADCGERQDVRE